MSEIYKYTNNQLISKHREFSLDENYTEDFNRFFKVLAEVKEEFTDIVLTVTDSSRSLIQLTVDNVYKWINVGNSERYIKEHILSMIIDDVDGYFAQEIRPASTEELLMMFDAGLDPFLFDIPNESDLIEF